MREVHTKCIVILLFLILTLKFFSFFSFYSKCCQIPILFFFLISHCQALSFLIYSSVMASKPVHPVYICGTKCTNYTYWSFLMRNFLLGRGLWKVVSGVTNKPPSDKAKELDEWETNNAEVLHSFQTPQSLSLGFIQQNCKISLGLFDRSIYPIQLCKEV